MDAFGLLVGHLVGDYIAQNDWMAQGKKKSSGICLIHCLLYTLAVCVFGQVPPHWGWWLAILVPHFLIDRTGFIVWWMRNNGQEKFLQPPLGPWSIIAVDNTFHLVCLLCVYRSYLILSEGVL